MRMKTSGCGRAWPGLIVQQRRKAEMLCQKCERFRGEALFNEMKTYPK